MFLDKIIQKIIKSIAGVKTVYFQIDITNACNLNCKHCYHHDHKKRDLSFEQWEKFFDDFNKLIRKLHLKPEIILCGGEPLLAKDLHLFIDYFEKNYPDSTINILTNATMITSDFISSVRNKKINFQVSLDGPEAKSHDFVRGVGNFDKAIKGIEQLLKANMNVSCQAILSKRNLECLEEFFILAKEIGISSMNFARFIPQGHGKTLFESDEDRPLIPLELKKAYHMLLSYSEKYGILTSTNKPHFHLIQNDLGSNGMWGFDSIIIDSSGNLKASSRADYILGNLLINKLDELFLKHPIMKKLRSGEIEICAKCEDYYRCGGDRNAAYAQSGNILGHDPSCWKSFDNETRK